MTGIGIEVIFEMFRKKKVQGTVIVYKFQKRINRLSESLRLLFFIILLCQHYTLISKQISFLPQDNNVRINDDDTLQETRNNECLFVWEEVQTT